MKKSGAVYFLSFFAGLSLVLLFSGCVSQNSIFDKHSRVKWVYKSGREFYRLPSPLMGRWAPQEFTDAGLFGDWLILSCENQGGTFQPERQHVYVIDTNKGHELYNVILPRVCQFHWHVQNRQLVVVSRGPDESPSENRYNLQTSLSRDQEDATSELGGVELDNATDSLKYIVFDRITEPPGPDRPYETTKHVWVGQIELGIRLVQEVHPGTERYNLYLESVSEGDQVCRVKLVRLRRFYPSFNCWVGHDSSGDYVVVLRYIALGVRKTDDCDKN